MVHNIIGMDTGYISRPLLMYTVLLSRTRIPAREYLDVDLIAYSQDHYNYYTSALMDYWTIRLFNSITSLRYILVMSLVPLDIRRLCWTSLDSGRDSDLSRDE